MSRTGATMPGAGDAVRTQKVALLADEVVVGNPFDVEFVTIQSILDKLTARAACATEPARL